MKPNQILLLVSWLTILNVNAQTFEWVKSLSGTNENRANSIALDGSGNVYTTGYFNGTADFDPGVGTYNLTSAADYDIFISKLNADGNLLWAKSMGGTDREQADGIALDGSDNVYITGHYRGTVDFDPGEGIFNLTSAGNEDIFISKYDASGNFVWAKSIGGPGYDRAFAITVDGLGNVYTTGGFSGIKDFNPGIEIYNLTSVGGADIFVLKLDTDGNFIWAKSMGGASGDNGQGIAIDNSGNVYITGVFQETANFDPGVETYNLTSEGGGDIFIQKMDVDGNFIWAKSMGGTFNDNVTGIVLDGLGNVLTTGSFQGTVDFDPSVGINNLTSAGSFDIFISKLDTSGNLMWAKRIGGTNIEQANGISLDNSGNVYITGSFWGTTDFDPGAGIYNITSEGDSDIFISKLDNAGNFAWAKSIRGTNGNSGLDIALDILDNVYTTGFFGGTADFNPGEDTDNLTSAGFSDIFILKLSQCSNTASTINIVSCNSYTVPSGNQSYSLSGTYNDTISNTASCDSIITINLTINSIDVSVTNNDPTLTANATVADYLWINCNDNSPINGETNQSFTPTSNGTYAVIVTQNECSDTSICYTIVSVGKEELKGDNPILTVYPNPSMGSFNIHYYGMENDSYSLWDVSGKVIRRGFLTKGNNIIALDNEIDGIYFLNVAENTFRLVKQKF